MQPNKINELIKSTHEMFKTRGDWDGLPELTPMPPMREMTEEPYYAMEHDKQERNAYLASKLDRITWSICDAMRARSINATMQPGDIDCFISGDYECFISTTYEHHLAKALLLTLDLMGFYGVEYEHMKSFLPCELEGRDQLSLMRSVAFIALKMLTWGGEIQYPQWSGLISLFLRIAELDKIDLEWHVEALTKYIEGEVK